MGMRIEGGKTGVNTALVDSDGKLEVRAVVEGEEQWAAERGDAYNLNTGTIALTVDGDNGVMYVKSNEDKILIIEQIIVGVGTQGTPADSAHVKIIRNPTSVSFSTTAGVLNQNRNFGSSNTLDSGTLVYKGADSATVTGGDETILFYVNGNTRMAAPINLELQKGNSLAVTINPEAASANVYVALVCHLKESEFSI